MLSTSLVTRLRISPCGARVEEAQAASRESFWFTCCLRSKAIRWDDAGHDVVHGVVEGRAEHVEDGEDGEDPLDGLKVDARSRARPAAFAMKPSKMTVVASPSDLGADDAKDRAGAGEDADEEKRRQRAAAGTRGAASTSP